MIVPVLIFSIFLIVLIIYTIHLHRQLRLARNRVRVLETLDMEKDKLFTVIGHDLNSFVNTGHAGLRLYRSGNLSPEDAQFILDGVEEKFHTASVTLQSLLNWGKSLFKGIAIRPATFDATHLINAELNLAGPVTRTKEITVINSMPREQAVYADLEHFKFIIRNLVSNAVKFSRAQGKIVINMTDKGREGFVVIAVTDSGIGMSDEKLKQVFFPFGASTDGTAKEKGNGIGLILCREYARQNGGELWAESQDGIGTTFYLAVKSSDHPSNYPFFER
jgi:signal transduction histidine kinase